jgi:hypothetical protein
MAFQVTYLRSFLEAHFDVQSSYSYGLIALLVATLGHYVVTLILYNSADHSKGNTKTPLIVPHFLPFLGSVPWQYFWNPIEFFRSRQAMTHPSQTVE